MPQQPFQPVKPRSQKGRGAPHARVARFEAGKEAPQGSFQAGDFILTHGSGVFSQLIRFGQRLRFHGDDRKYAWWSHAALIVSSSGNLIEAVGAGVLRSHLSKYKHVEYYVVNLGEIADFGDREQAVDFAEWSLGEQYAWFNIVSIAIALALGGKFTFGFDGQAICSGLVARALERTDAIFNRSPSHIMPADLAKYFNVEVALA